MCIGLAIEIFRIVKQQCQINKKKYLWNSLLSNPESMLCEFWLVHFLILMHMSFIFQADQRVLRQLIVTYLPELDSILKEHDIGELFVCAVKKKSLSAYDLGTDLCVQGSLFAVCFTKPSLITCPLPFVLQNPP